MNQNYGCSDSSELKDINKLVEKIGAQLGAVEEVINLGERYQGIVVAKVVECVKHPNADKLSLCLIDDNNVVKDVKRNENGLVQVVCGAPNVRAGISAAWIPPGAVVPSTFDKDPFVISARPIRNKTSHGMLASARELALGDDHEGILILDGDTKPGTPLTQALNLDDYIIDIENKMFTHRPDLFGILGIAREIAGIYGKPFKSPAWYDEYADVLADGRKNVLKLTVKNEVPKLVPRFCAIAIKDVKVADSPAWLKAWLARVGIRPINNIVDATNFFMYETAQPLHAYDYDKVKTGTLGVSLSKKGEKLKLLGGKEVTLNDGAVVITDGDKPVGLGGVMGGADTEVDKTTKNIILEVANFDMNTTRRTAMAYGLFTDAATRFTKNQSPRQNRAVLVKAVSDIRALAGGRAASPIVDINYAEARSKTVEVSADFINARLGLKLTIAEIKHLLENVEFGVSAERTGLLRITAPFWRTDIEIPEDIVEEVGRLYGYDHLPQVVPNRPLSPAQPDKLLVLKARLRDILASAGANEVLTYSFVNERLLRTVGQEPKEAYHIKNALSPDLQYYRLSLTPSLLEKVNPNIRAGFEQFVIFEIGKAHGKSETENSLPKEFERLALVLASKPAQPGAAFFWAKAYVEYLAEKLNLELGYEPLEETKFAFKDHKLFTQMLAPYEPKRTALIFAGDRLAGAVGEFKVGPKSALKLPQVCAGAELFLSTLGPARGDVYRPLNKYPSTEQDICFRTAVKFSWGELTDFISGSLGKLAQSYGYDRAIEPLDIYQRAGDRGHKQTTWRITLSHPERTLTTEEVNKLFDKLESLVKKEFKAERI
ncbi:MAG TPA: phenylalanine--tRNA ligase subunit beta [Candidatus Saccharimonadales bacterium]|nr:phenylalanine--tRNA ligase subunit beta [Candidatus Saccharimonadales bacterium]